MEIVIGTLEFGAIGGAATYLTTVAGQLQLLGHGVTVYAEEVGDLARAAEERGLRVAVGEGALPDECDVIYAQDAPSAYLLADRYPGRPQAFCMHAGASGFARWLPPQLPGVVGAVVVLHERMAQQAAALAHREQIVRLTQPVDLTRFAPRAAVAESPRRVLLLGNYLTGERRAAVLRACDEAELEVTDLGRYADRTSLTPEQEINLVDLVIGEGRTIVEAMACGRAAFVYGQMGGDGWVTPETYPGLEAINFAGATADNTLVRPEDLGARLREYRASMGSANRDLARLHHSAARHAEELVALFERLEPGDPPPNTPFREFARMSRVQWQTESRALGASHEARLLSTRLAEAEARAEAAEARADVADASLETLRSAPWYRFLRALARPLRRRDE
jgi:hypothetical protein